MFSIEYLYRECNLKNKCLHLELKNPILLEDQLTKDLILLKIDDDEVLRKNILLSLMNCKNTNEGTFKVLVSDKRGEPYNPQIVHLDLQNIETIWQR